MTDCEPNEAYYANYVLAVDIGFRATGLALFDITKLYFILKDVKCVKPKKIKKTKDDYVSVVDAMQVQAMTRGIVDYIKANHVQRIVVELPSGGAKSSRAVRLMGMASAMMAAIVTMLDLKVEWHTPREVKIAATDKPKAEKDEMMDAMSKIFPIIKNIPKVRKEHIADACACLLAANDGVMVQEIRSHL